MELSIVVAVYNEEEVLDELHRRLSAALDRLGRSYEIILVDDGSRDRSIEVILKLREADPRHVRVLSFTRNFGHHIALTAGLDAAVGDVIVMMDADLQDQPEEIQKLLSKLDEGYDVVWGEREARQFSWYKNLSSKLFLWLMNSVARAEVPLDSSIFRAMRRPVADDLRGLREKARYLPGLVRWLGYKQTSVPVEHGKRFAGETKYSLWRLLKLALSTATSFSAAPLQFATLSGMAAAGVAVVLVVYILARKLMGGYTVPGYASIMIAIFAFGALQLIVIGLMGEYISRIYREAQGRPLYLLKDLPGSDEKLVRSESKEISRSSAPVKRLSEISLSARTELLDVLASDPHLPLANVFSGANAHELAEYHLKSWEHSNPNVFSFSEGERLQTAALFHELEFDTRVLGLKAARLLYANSIGSASVEHSRIVSLSHILVTVLGHARETAISLVDARVSNQDLFIARAFEQAGFHAVDLLVTLGATRRKIDIILDKHEFAWQNDRILFSPSLVVRPMHDGEELTLADISAEAFSDHSMIQDRFFLEPSISPERAKSLFHRWAINLSRKHHEGTASMLVAEVDGRAVGFLGLEPMAPFQATTWWKDSLNAVGPGARGQGVYRALVVAALAHVQKMEGGGIITKTQSSTYRVINTWLHLGCDILESAATFHWTSAPIKGEPGTKIISR